jgi:hypothetical protein
VRKDWNDIEKFTAILFIRKNSQRKIVDDVQFKQNMRIHPLYYYLTCSFQASSVAPKFPDPGKISEHPKGFRLSAST